jgi:phosphatidylethanolamine-binding protein (PEBP) family uncharacterized protein
MGSHAGYAAGGGAGTREATLSPVPRHLVTVSLAASLLLGACSDDGRSLAPVRPDQTTTTEAPPTIDDGVDDIFALGSDAFEDGGDLPVRFTCTGDGVSPSLRWSGTPEGLELALVVRDRETTLVQWLVTGIDPLIQSFGEGAVPEGAVEQVNSTGAIGWLAPCPDAGSGTHTYDFVLHVLTSRIDIDPSLPAADAAALIENASGPEAPYAGKVTAPE